MVNQMICDECQALYEEVGDRARDSGQFGKVRRTDLFLQCGARFKEQNQAVYRVEVDDDHKRVYVGLYMPDRWLNESIETDLLHSGDGMEELLEEELAELDCDVKPAVEHYRNDDLEFVFRSVVALPEGEELDGPAMIDRVTKVLLAYEAAMSELGDMSERGA